MAHAIRAYRRYHDCDLNTARKAVLALVTPKPPEPKRAAVDEPAGLDLAAEYEKRFKLVVPNVRTRRERAIARASTRSAFAGATIALIQETAKRMVSNALKAQGQRTVTMSDTTNGSPRSLLRAMRAARQAGILRWESVPF